MANRASAPLTASLLESKGRATALGFAPAGTSPLAALRPVAPTHRKRCATSGGDGTGPAPRRAKVSLRLDHERHLRLKLLSAHLGKSGQELLVEALDQFISRQAPNTGSASACACLAARKLIALEPVVGPSGQGD